MTTEDFAKVAELMGWEKTASVTGDCWWTGFPGNLVFRGRTSEKSSLTPAETIEALSLLAEKGYWYELYTALDNQHGLDILFPEWKSDEHNMHEDPNTVKGIASTIPEAVTIAMFALATKEPPHN